MRADVSDAAGAALVRIDGDLTIAAAAEQAARLRAALPGHGDVALDLGAVGDCDSAGVQLLLALRGQLARQRRALTLVAAGGSVIEALRTFGLHALLGVEPAAADAPAMDAAS